MNVTQEQKAAALAAARAAIQEMSEMYSSMITDEDLEKVVDAALNAVSDA